MGDRERLKLAEIEKVRAKAQREYQGADVETLAREAAVNSQVLLEVVSEQQVRLENVERRLDIYLSVAIAFAPVAGIVGTIVGAVIGGGP